MSFKPQVSGPSAQCFSHGMLASNQGISSMLPDAQCACSRLLRLSRVTAGCVVMELSSSENNSPIERWSLAFTITLTDPVLSS
jgi:hypothetical protein